MNTKTLNSARRYVAVLAISGLVVVLAPASRAACIYDPVTGQQKACDPTSTPGGSLTDPDAIAAINAQIAEKQKIIDDLKQKTEQYEEQVNQTQTEIRSLEGEVAAINNQITLTTYDIQSKEAQIDALDLETRSLQLSIDQKNADIEAKRSVLADTIRELDASTRTTPLTLVMQYQNFDEFFSAAQAQAQMSAGLQAAIGVIQKSKAEIQAKQDELQRLKDDATHAKLQLEDQRAAIEEQQNYKSSLLSKSRRSAAQYSQLLDESQSEADAVNSLVAQLQSSLQSKMSGGSTVDLPSPSGFIWPVSSRTINATFLDPNYHMRGSRHYGIDIDVDQGTPVKATAYGIVERVIMPPTIGTTPSIVQIRHGDGYVSYYIHLHQIYVAAGQTVEMGQIIGLSGGQCGTAGAGMCNYYTTGAHLHFEMHNCAKSTLSNCAINPLNYLP